ncbi:methyltransferase family protein [Motilibacter rhizosphaerae]|uniref:Arsenite methyltransferase n=1 Tax=Motilibacter rhizosphaerae TaxID=598652 RepID=A0A4Q7NBZ1_9ACTN|nr:arsenite methyltransferase [Motilibacter rhizosphaerae]RZS80137.1 methyltransferase family protein [Motilibacter rhizosphaerae]
MDQDVREQVRERYAAAARVVAAGGHGSCGSADALDQTDAFGAARYATDELDGLPAEAVAASLGCGNPLVVADLQPGERVLDLGSGGGIDVLLSAKRVGATGKAYGLDMTDEMLALALANKEKAGATNVEFLKGHIEEIPLPAGTIDVIISNCVINLSTDKTAVLAEMFRVLAPGGRIGISDVVAEDHVTPAQRAERGSYAGCIAGALSRREYLEGLAAAGFVDATVEFTHEAAEGLHGAIVRATKPTAATTEARATAPASGLTSAGDVEGACCSTGAEASCCAPAAKAECCSAGHPSGSCGCR